MQVTSDASLSAGEKEVLDTGLDSINQVYEGFINDLSELLAPFSSPGTTGLAAFIAWGSQIESDPAKIEALLAKIYHAAATKSLEYWENTGPYLIGIGDQTQESVDAKIQQAKSLLPTLSAGKIFSAGADFVAKIDQWAGGLSK